MEKKRKKISECVNIYEIRGGFMEFEEILVIT